MLKCGRRLVKRKRERAKICRMCENVCAQRGTVTKAEVNEVTGGDCRAVHLSLQLL